LKRKSPIRHIVRTKHPGKGRPTDVTTRKRAKEFHRKRSLKAQELDEKLDATVTDQYEEWAQNPNRLDIYGVDYFPVESVPGRPDLTFKRLENAMIDYYGYNPKEVKKVTPVFCYTYADYEKHGGNKNLAGFYQYSKDGKVAKLVLSPSTSNLIKKGKVEKQTDFFALKTLAHEYQHHLNYQQTKDGHTRLEKGFSEGLTELLSTRFAMLAFKMDPKLRKKLEVQPRTVYVPFLNMVGDTALIVNDFNEPKAIEWLKELSRASPEKREKMIDDAEDKLRKHGFEVGSYKENFKKQQLLHKLEYDKYLATKDRLDLSKKLLELQKKLREEGIPTEFAFKLDQARAKKALEKAPFEKITPLSSLINEYNYLYEAYQETIRKSINLDIKIEELGEIEFTPFSVQNETDENLKKFLDSTFYLVYVDNNINANWWIDDA